MGMSMSDKADVSKHIVFFYYVITSNDLVSAI